MGFFARNAALEEAQAGIKIAGTNINNLRYADDTTLMAERDARVTAGPKRPHLSVCPGPNFPLQGRQGSRVHI